MSAQPGRRARATLTHARADAVNERALAARARALGLDAARAPRPRRAPAGRARKDSILANAFEAVLGALYLDGGLERRAPSWRASSAPSSPSRARASATRRRSCSSCCRRGGREPPSYVTVAATGPAHAREFSVEVRAGATLLGVGSGALEARRRAGRARAPHSPHWRPNQPAPTRGEIALSARES